MVIAIIITTIVIFVLSRLSKVGFVLDLISYETQEKIEQILSVIMSVLFIGGIILTAFVLVKVLL